MNKQEASIENRSTNGTTYYCPMRCEGDKTYNKPGNCPVCGMHLVPVQGDGNKKQQLHQPEKHPVSAVVAAAKYYYPIHCEREKVYDKPGNCPVCEMNLVPIQSKEEDENKSYNDLLKKLKIAVIFTLSVFLTTMSEMLSGKPLLNIATSRYGIGYNLFYHFH